MVTSARSTTWGPGQLLSLHRHLCDVTSLVLEGELHVKTYEDGELVNTAIRRPGDHAKSRPVMSTWSKGVRTARWCCSSFMRPMASSLSSWIQKERPENPNH